MIKRQEHVQVELLPQGERSEDREHRSWYRQNDRREQSCGRNALRDTGDDFNVRSSAKDYLPQGSDGGFNANDIARVLIVIVAEQSTWHRQAIT